MANFLSGFLDNLTQGLGNPKGTLGDFAHASRLYNSNAFRLAPKVKFLYHVVFNINPAAARMTMFDTQKHGTAVNMLVKEVSLPKYKIQVDSPYQYNRKKQVHTKLEYDPINVVFHDDNVGLTTALWTMYYNYYFADGKNPDAYRQNTFKASDDNKFRYGLDNDFTEPFFSSIQIFQLERHTYHSFTLINPIITSWQHDTLNNAESQPVQSSMTVAYEAVIYDTGLVGEDSPSGFATDYYDKMPSPLLPLGGGTTSVFGQGGVFDGITDVLGSVLSGSAFSNPSAFLGTIIKGTNVIRNANRITRQGVVDEGSNIIKNALGTLSNTNVSGVANIQFPTSQALAVTNETIANAPQETYMRNVNNAASIFTTNVIRNPTKYANAVTSIARSAAIQGLPTSPSEFNQLSQSQQSQTLSKIENEYNSGNTKVIGLVHKYVKQG